jgi:hypothetical protein
MTGFEKQVLLTIAVAWFFWRMTPTPASTDYDGTTQVWAGSGVDPFGVSYTVSQQAMRGGL